MFRSCNNLQIGSSQVWFWGHLSELFAAAAGNETDETCNRPTEAQSSFGQ